MAEKNTSHLTPAELKLPALPLAENMEGQVLHDFGGMLAMRKTDTVLTAFEIAWNNLEIGLLESSESYTNKAFEDLYKLREHPNFDLGRQPFASIELTIAYEKMLRQRTLRNNISKRALHYTYGTVTSLMQAIMDGDFPLDVKSGTGSELIFHSAILRKKDVTCLPYVTSTREERNKVEQIANHNGYIVTGEQYDQKVPAQIQTSNMHEASHPDVKVIQLHPIINGSINQYPDVQQQLNQGKATPVARKLARLKYVSDWMAHEATGNTPPGPAINILESISSAIHNHLVPATNTKYKDPLTQNLADLLKNWQSDS